MSCKCLFFFVREQTRKYAMISADVAGSHGSSVITTGCIRYSSSSPLNGHNTTFTTTTVLGSGQHRQRQINHLDANNNDTKDPVALELRKRESATFFSLDDSEIFYFSCCLSFSLSSRS